MGRLIDYPPHQSTKTLVMADSGGGKTGALCSLATAGYKLRILDADNKLHILRNILSTPGNPYGMKAIQNIDSITVTEKMKNLAGTLVPASAKAWGKCTALFDCWKDETTNYGSIFSWGPDTILVIDTLTMVSNFAMNWVLALNSRLGQTPYQSDWGEAQRLLRGLVVTLYDTQIKCHVIVNCHITRIGKEESSVSDKGVVQRYTVSGTEKAYPLTLGKALSPEIGRYFDSALLIEGGKIHTKARADFPLKSTNPITVPATFPLSTGLADYFKIVVGALPPPTPALAPPEGTPGTPQTGATITNKDTLSGTTSKL